MLHDRSLARSQTQTELDDSPGSGCRRRAARQRGADRVPLAVDVAFGVPGRYLQWGRTRDLSLGGAYIETPAPAPFGARLTLLLPLPGFGRPAEIQCVVRWSDAGGMGLQLGAMSARETYALILLLDEGKQ
jgi:hypothetical protein